MKKLLLLASVALLVTSLISVSNTSQAHEDPSAGTHQHDPAMTGNTVDIASVVAELSNLGDTAIAAYTAESGDETADQFSDLYFDVFEASGMELAVGLYDANLKTRLESLFSTLIGLCAKGTNNRQVTLAWQQLKQELEKTSSTLSQGNESGYWALLLQAFLILIREGFEAILVVTALTAYLRRSGAENKLKVIHYGVAWALGASVLTAWLMHEIFQVSGAQQELVEGISMLLAALVLFYVSYWLIAKREAGRWQQYVNNKIDSALSGNKLFALGFAAFLAVYREGAETVLFYQAMVSGATADYSAIGLGALLAACGLFAIFWIMKTASFKLPITLFFSLTAVLLYLMAIIFAGKGVLELQEARWLSITPLDWAPTIEWLGVFPTSETLLTQSLLIAIAALSALYLIGRKALTDNRQRAAL